MATINDYTRAFEKHLKLRNCASSTINLYCSILKQFIGHFKKDPHSITADMIGDFILTRTATRTKRQTWYTLDNFYRDVLQMTDHLKSIPIPRQEKYIPETLNEQEVLRMINTIQNIKHRAIIQLIYACALRIGEAVNLRIADIDGQRLQLHIKQSKGAKDRVIPIPQQTLDLLREYFKQYHPKEFLFTGQDGGRYDVRSIQQIFHRARRAARILKKVTVHTLRHSRATHLLCNGVDVVFIQKLLGHSKVETTNNFYLHTDVTDLQRAIMRADHFFIQQKELAA